MSLLVKAGPIDRRAFLGVAAAAGAGLVIAFRLPAGDEAEAGEATADSAARFAPNAWLRVDPEGEITIWMAKSEMGQGVKTALPMIVAEELEADWRRVRIEQADFNQKYGDQGTGGSSSVRESYEPLRKAGAAAREMLVAAAAATWGVEKGTCSAREGSVLHAASNRALTYGQLVAKAATLPVPEAPRLKDPGEFRLIGTKTPRVDTPSKIAGKATYGIDVRVPGMLYAVVARCPVLRGRPVSHDPAKTLEVPGVKRVVVFRSGVAVLADSTWAAMEGRRRLEVVWDEGEHANLSSESLRKQWEAVAEQPGADARHDGDPGAALAAAGKKIDAVYELPFLAHAPMEPQNCTADVRSGSCEIWAPTQVPDDVQAAAEKITRLPGSAIKVHVTLMGGGFGRRLDADYAEEAIFLSKEVGAPVMVVFSRDDDMQHDFYRPGSRHILSGAVSKEGKLSAWTHRVVAPSIGGQRGGRNEGMDRSAMHGADDIPYEIPNVHVDYVMSNTPVPTGWWRSVYSSQNGFVSEAFFDELAAAAGKDPFELRRSLLSKAPRHRRVLELAAEKAGWGTAPAAGRHRGIALVKSFGSFVAQVAEVSVATDGAVRVHRVVCAVDCGRVINPDTVEAQMEGGIVFGLSAALYGEITLEKGRVQQANFDGYRVLRMDAVPIVEVHIVPSEENPAGVGEPGVPVIAPAVVNAIFAATGKRVRRLPIRPADLKTA